MGGKRILVFAGVTISAILLLIFLISTAPAINCFLGLILYDKWGIISYDSDIILVYNWILGIITAVMTCITIIISRVKKLRLYSALIIPYIVALILAMIYAGLNIDYIEGGYIELQNHPFSRGYVYKNEKGKTIIKSSEYLVKLCHNGKIVFADNYGIYPYRLYDEYGTLFLTAPMDDDYENRGIKLVDEYYYTTKSFYKDWSFDYERVRFFDMNGNYIITREYREFNPKNKRKPGKLIKEYREEVDEEEDGIKIFQTEQS